MIKVSSALNLAGEQTDDRQKVTFANDILNPHTVYTGALKFGPPPPRVLAGEVGAEAPKR